MCMWQWQRCHAVWGHRWAQVQESASPLATGVSRYCGSGRAPIRDVPVWMGPGRCRGRAMRTQSESADAQHLAGPFQGAFSGPQSRMTPWCALAGVVTACTNTRPGLPSGPSGAGVLVGRGPARPKAGRSGSACPCRTAPTRWSTGCWPRCPGGRRYGAKVTSVRRRWVIVLVAAAAAGCMGGGSRAPSPAPTSPPAPASTVTWTDCRLPSAPGALVGAVAAGGDGMPWTAVGQEGGAGSSDPVRPAVWTSPDGCAWRRAAVAPVTPDGQRTGFSAVARRGRVVAALGRSYSQVHGNIRPTLWRSDAGTPLREVELLRELFGGGRGITMDGLVATPQAFLATGAYIGPDGNAAVHVWRSTNGRDWVRLPPARAQSSTPAEQLLPRDIAAGAAGSLLVGTSFRLTGNAGFDGATWYAPTAARQWQRVDLSGTGLADGGDQRLLAAVPLGDGYVAVGAVGSGGGFQLRSAVSRDGVRWSAGGPLSGQPLPAGQQPAADVTRLPGGGVVAGTAASGRAELWVSPDGRSWTPELVPGRAHRANGVVLGASPDRLVMAVHTPAGPQLRLGRRTR